MITVLHMHEIITNLAHKDILDRFCKYIGNICFGKEILMVGVAFIFIYYVTGVRVALVSI